MEERHYTQRKTPRAYFHNYDAGNYFITICTAFKKHYFGEIYHDKMALSPIGEYCKMQWEQLTTHYPYATVPLFVVMPNHVHAIVCVEKEENKARHRPTLGIVVGGIKREVSMFARHHGFDFGWQARYHDHIIRNSEDCNRVAEYIENNVARWQQDCFYG